MNIPLTNHWAIITSQTTYVPGDQRSRQSPGHGYPEHYIESIHYEPFSNYDYFLVAVNKLAQQGRKFTAVAVNPLHVSIQSVVSVSS